MSANDLQIIELMITYCQRVAKRISHYQISEQVFTSNNAYADMLLMPVFQIGELVNKLSDECKDSFPEVPWYQIKGFRNVIAHDYGAVQPQWAWRTLVVDIPALEKSLADVRQHLL